MSTKVPITVAYGDGIGPEIMEATLKILDAAGAQLDIETIEVGEKVYRQGISSGMDATAWDSLRRTKVFLKAPITTPQGGGYKSLNVTMRKTLNLYANVRPCHSYHPYIQTKHPELDVVIIRENEEDLYAGIEHQQTRQVVQCLKLITRPGSEKIVRYAFEYARAYGRKKVTCFTKDNIMKQTDGLFHEVFNEIAAEYPDIENEHWIIDIGSALLADSPERFDVIVTTNLYGDVISDIAAQITGSVGLCGSANVGEGYAMFEAIHGSAPTIAGQNIANPSGLLHGAILMLVHINQPDVASTIHNAWLKTIEDGVHTTDIYKEGASGAKVSTSEFGDALIARLGQMPEKFAAVSYQKSSRQTSSAATTDLKSVTKELVGVDVFIDDANCSPDALAAQLNENSTEALKLKMITNRGVKVWPDGMPETFCTDHWRCRFVPRSGVNGTTVRHADILDLLGALDKAGVDFIKTEHLYSFDGKRGYSLAQGE